MFLIVLLALSAAAEPVAGKSVYTVEERAMIEVEARRFRGYVLLQMQRRSIKLRKLSPSFHRKLRLTAVDAGLADPGALAYFNAHGWGLSERELDRLFWTLRDRPEQLSTFLRLRWEADGRPGDSYPERAELAAGAPVPEAETGIRGTTFDGIFARLGIEWVDSGGKSMGELLDGH